MRIGRHLSLFVISLLLGGLIVPAGAVVPTSITGVVEPPSDLGTVPVGSTTKLHFEVLFSGATRAMSIIQISSPGTPLTYKEMAATMGGVDVSSEFDVDISDGVLTVNCTSISTPDGLLAVDIILQAGNEEGNFTMDWRNVAVAYQAPPNPPITHDVSGSSNVEVVYGVEVSFYNGWNLLGVPTNLRNPSIGGAFGPSVDMVDYVYGFDNENKEFTFWIRGLPDGVQTVKTLEATRGYWVFTNADFTRTLLFSGMAPGIKSESPLNGKTVKIGFISASTTALETAQPFLQQIIEPDLNEYAQALGYNVTFQFVIEDANGNFQTHLEKVQGFKASGISMFIGGGWSSQAQASLSYVNANGMLMMSTSSTYSGLAIAGDRLYRLSPSDSAFAPALVDMMWSYGIKEVVIISRGDSWGDGIVNLFRPAWTAKGGTLAGDTIRYAVETTNFTTYLSAANTQADSAVTAMDGEEERVGVLLLSFDEFPVIAQQAQDYLPLYDCPFFGSDGTARSIQGMDDAPQQVNHMRVFSLSSQEPSSSKYTDIRARYEALTSQYLGFYGANIYDAAWIFAKGVLEAQSTDANIVTPLIQRISYDYYGASGWCKLNEFGDRVPPTFNIWFFAPGLSSASASYIGGSYDPDLQVTTWNNAFLQSKLGYTPLGP